MRFPSSRRRWKIPGAPSQPSLSWIAPTPREFASLSPVRVASTHSSSARHDPAVAEPPRRLLAQDPGRLAPLVALDDAARDVQIAVRGGERGRVQPRGVVVLREHDRRRLAGDRVERLLRRLRRGTPVAVSASRSRAASGPAGPSPRRSARRASSSEPQPSSFTCRCASDQVGKWTCESVKAGRTQRPPRSTTSGLASAVSWTPTPPATYAPAIASARLVGSEGSIVLTTPFSRITAVSLAIRTEPFQSPSTAFTGSGVSAWRHHTKGDASADLLGIAVLAVAVRSCWAVAGGAAAAVAPAAITGPVSSVGATSATVTGTVNPNGQATSWYVEYGTSTSYGSRTASQNAGSGTANAAVSASLTGLTPGTTYHYRVVATNARRHEPRRRRDLHDTVGAGSRHRRRDERDACPRRRSTAPSIRTAARRRGTSSTGRARATARGRRNGAAAPAASAVGVSAPVSGLRAGRRLPLPARRDERRRDEPRRRPDASRRAGRPTSSRGRRARSR